MVTGIDGTPVGKGGRGIVAAADPETHEALMSLIADTDPHRGSTIG